MGQGDSGRDVAGEGRGEAGGKTAERGEDPDGERRGERRAPGLTEVRAEGRGAAVFTALTSFAGAAGPYAGGHPYDDYRRGALPFTGLADLADRRLGAGIIAARDEFLADRENLLLPGPAVFDPERVGRRGGIADERPARRRRGRPAEVPQADPRDHDWALVRLGVPGVVRGIVVDTAHFRGDHPGAVSVDATRHSLSAAPEDVLDPEVEWTELVAPTPVGGHAANAFAVHVERRFTHLRLRRHPGGGVARLRVYGEVVPDPGWLAELETFDLVALENGGSVEDASDRYHSPPEHTLLPGRAWRADDGWQTRRRRDGGHDWIRYRLVEQGVIRAVEIDTAYLKGNAAGWASLSVRDGDEGAWTPLIPRIRLQPDTGHRFLVNPVPATHARLDILSDGGVSRVRLHGSLTRAGAARLMERSEALG